jgi:hypothetical protein
VPIHIAIAKLLGIDPLETLVKTRAYLREGDTLRNLADRFGLSAELPRLSAMAQVNNVDISVRVFPEIYKFYRHD